MPYHFHRTVLADDHKYHYEFIGDADERSSDALEDDEYLLDFAVSREADKLVIKSIEHLIDGSVQERYLTTRVHIESFWRGPFFGFLEFVNKIGDTITWVGHDLTNIPTELLTALKRLDVNASSSASSAAASSSASSAAASSSAPSAAARVTGKRDSSSNPNAGGGALERPKVKRKTDIPNSFHGNHLWTAARGRGRQHYKSSKVNDSMVQQAIFNGANPNHERQIQIQGGDSLLSTTPLYWAVVNHNSKMAEILLKAGADPNYRCKTTPDESGDTRAKSILWLACEYTPIHSRMAENDLTMVSLLIQSGADPNKGFYVKTYHCINPLTRMAGKRYGKRLVKILLDKGANPNGTIPPSHYYAKMTPLYEAIDNGCFDAAKLLIAAGANMNPPDPPYTPPLMQVCKGGRITWIGIETLIEPLIKAGADPNYADTDGNTPLLAVCSEWYRKEEFVIRAAAKLIELGANVNQAKQRGAQRGSTPLSKALEIDEFTGKTISGALVILLVKAGATHPTISSEHCLAIAFNETCRRDGMEVTYTTTKLLDAGADVNYADQSGKTLLVRWLTAKKSHVSVSEQKATVKKIIDLGADVNFADHSGSTPLKWACKQCEDNFAPQVFIDIITLLIEAGATITDELQSEYNDILVLALPEDMVTERGFELAVNFGEFHKDEATGKIVPNDDFLCPICQELLKDNDWIVRRCGHAFCKECAVEWGRRSDTCPRCRSLGVDFHGDDVYRLQEDMYANLRF